ncbi:MAG: hypothetical protein IPO80_04505 [Propionibacteriaceae bacterium]|nr:hypothetical protein [Propionibacteriaceae bacterium]
MFAKRTMLAVIGATAGLVLSACGSGGGSLPTVEPPELPNGASSAGQVSGTDFDDDPVAGSGWKFTTPRVSVELAQFYQQVADRKAGRPVNPTHQSSKATCWSWQESGHWSSIGLIQGTKTRFVVFNAATTTPEPNLEGQDRCELARKYISEFDAWLG